MAVSAPDSGKDLEGYKKLVKDMYMKVVEQGANPSTSHVILH